MEATVRRPEEWHDSLSEVWWLATKDFTAGPRGRLGFEEPLRVRITVEVLAEGDKR